MTSSFFTLVISPISLMVICGRSPLSDLRSMRISRMVWDQ
uniref:Uncharacterized protein n=1 Tax=Anguilla anguilla TaxID=7936 RepID=A0A0E9W7W3_ANGAN